ncbi:MAG: tRNA (adenosine(37)-N6)-dimethylallyltransferase MiaA [Gammaproteobacteria bacterium]
MPLPVIFLLGPTTAGKTGLAAALRDAHPVDLISVDAAQVYRGMDIGTGKPDAAFLRAYPHALIDIRAPADTYNAARFCEDARALIAQSHARGRLPLLVGGTMFYFAALEHGLSALPSGDAEVRAEIAREMAARGVAAMHARLCGVDARLAAGILPSDRQRIARALEIHRLTGRRPSAVMAESAAVSIPFPLIKVGLFTAERAVLHRRIDARFRAMLERGLVEEVQGIAAALDDPAAQPCMRTVNYRQAHAYLRGEIGFDAMVEKSIAATRQLAKRQLTWMRRWRDLVWIDATEKSFVEVAQKHVRERLAEYL